MRKSSGRVRWMAIVSLALTLVVVPSTVASANDNDQQDTLTIIVPMVFGGYDSAVAEAHGYRIETLPGGNQISVPVTNDAKEETRRARVASGIVANGAVTGPCGTSSLALTRRGTAVRVVTSYNVVGVSTGHVWNVDVHFNNGIVFPVGFTGFASSSSWAASSTTNTSFNVGGWGVVTPGSFAILTDGRICYSGSPTDLF